MNITEIKEETGVETLIWELLEEVMDPEIRALSVVDLGIIPQIEVKDNAFITIYLTPTFSGCPAIHVMQKMIRDKILDKLPDYAVEVKVDFERTWNSNLITEKGREALKNFELAPPKKYTGELDMETIKDADCPMCGSHNTTMQSPFGPTLCRAIHYCYDCKQSFQQFKPI
jgi:ring-1,2-phenylacetyl-CoA epoxidase subunit PaaD